MKNLNIIFLRFVLVILFSSLLLTACGSEAKPTSVPPAPTSSPTIAATATVAPTAIPPSPTPTPLPTSFFLGAEGSPWGELTRYTPGTTDKFMEVDLTPELVKELAPWFQIAPRLAKNNGAKENTYSIKITPVLAAGMAGGTIKLNDIRSEVGILYDDATKSWKLPFSIPGSLDPMAIYKAAGAIFSQQYLNVINEQYNQINQSLNTIKNFLKEKEYGAIEGNLNYLNTMRLVLNQQKLTPDDLDKFRTQLENIDRESGQAMAFAKRQMTSAYDSFKTVKLDKNLLVFRDESAMDDLQKHLDDFNLYSDIYLLALSVKGLSGQTLCALPASRELAKTRLELAKTDLAQWKEEIQKFYSDVEKRIPDMDGLFSSEKKPLAFKEAAKKGRENSTTSATKLDTVFSDTLKKLNEQVKLSSEPLILIGELDNQSNLTKINRVVKA